ncbi:hypothetical protein SO694_00001051 [Aureococcus anophagefferens]|uniref:Major facilitator superfamily (MFS) profile domain-containing protein n=1 Tax=Aureococcus anophagefferens TaxID=44056 RepID=A0ABR1GBF6_AURAN
MNGAGAFDKYASVASSFAPVILAQFLVPTLDASYGREFRSVGLVLSGPAALDVLGGVGAI